MTWAGQMQSQRSLQGEGKRVRVTGGSCAGESRDWRDTRKGRQPRSAGTSGAGRAKETNCPPEPPEGLSPAHTLQ